MKFLFVLPLSGAIFAAMLAPSPIAHAGPTQGAGAQAFAACKACHTLEVPWQGIMALVMIPAAATVIIAAATAFPPPLREQSGVSFGEMMGEVFRRPGFFIWFGAMFLTAASELAPGQWIDVALSNRVGMRGILLLVYVNALMFVFRHFAGRLANKISNPGLLWVSSLLATIGPFMLPQLGAMFDRAKIEFAGGPEAFARLTGAAKLAVEDAAASLSFQRLAILPVVVLAIFGFTWLRERGKSRTALAGEAA